MFGNDTDPEPAPAPFEVLTVIVDSLARCQQATFG
jgi:hypothetical protein